MHRSTILRTTAAATLAAMLTLAACGGGDDEADTATETAATATASTDGSTAAAVGGESQITIESFAFGGVTSVAAGTTITVVNNDSTAHTFTADDGSFDSGSIDPGGSFEITLDEAGTFGYHCGFHSSMTGTITVTA